MREYEHIDLVASAARTTSDNGTPKNVARHRTLVATLNVSAASGTTPTLDVVIEDSADGATWTTLATFAQKTGTGAETVRITNPCHPNIRARWTIGGTTPSFTFDVKVTARDQ